MRKKMSSENSIESNDNDDNDKDIENRQRKRNVLFHLIIVFAISRVWFISIGCEIRASVRGTMYVHSNNKCHRQYCMLR